MKLFTFIATVAKRIAMLSLIPVCLSATCLSEQAAANPIIKTITGPGKRIPGTDSMGTDTNLGFGPGTGKGSGHIKPAICGLLGLSGIFDNATVVRIEVENDYYHLVRRWSVAHSSQPAYWVGAVATCVEFAQFKMTPPRSDWRVFAAPPAASSGGGTGTYIPISGSGTQYACIWAGVAGSLSAVPAPSSEGLPNVASTQLNLIMNASGNYAQSTGISSLTSYAWCSGFNSPFNWTYSWSSPVTPWSTGGLLPGGVYPPISSTEAWCYMAGVMVGIPGKIKIWPSFPSGNYAEDISKGTQMLWNCLPYTQ